MAKPAKPADDTEKVLTPQEQTSSYLKANKVDHYNYEETITDKTKASSLQLMAAMDGGLAPGAHRAVGRTTGGKTSCTLDFMHHFLETDGGKGRRGLYVKSEGRLSPEVMARSGIVFTTNPDEWKDGTCFVVESQVYEFIFGLMGELIRNNPTGVRYCFILDSLDMMAKRADLEKGLEEAGQVAGGALITSVFLKKTSVALAKRGHICWFISQVRDSIKINPYEKGTPRQGNASGGHAVEHAGDWVLEFLERYNDDIIRETPGDNLSKPIGHYCRIRIVKSNNEKYGVMIRYPIKYGRVGATSVWIEREIADLLIQWELLTKAKGSWFDTSPGLLAEIKEATGVDFPPRLNGLNNVYKALEDDPKTTAFLYDKFLKLITGK